MITLLSKKITINKETSRLDEVDTQNIEYISEDAVTDKKKFPAIWTEMGNEKFFITVEKPLQEEKDILKVPVMTVKKSKSTCLTKATKKTDESIIVAQFEIENGKLIGATSINNPQIIFSKFVGKFGYMFLKLQKNQSVSLYIESDDSKAVYRVSINGLTTKNGTVFKSNKEDATKVPRGFFNHVNSDRVDFRDSLLFVPVNFEVNENILKIKNFNVIKMKKQMSLDEFKNSYDKLSKTHKHVYMHEDLASLASTLKLVIPEITTVTVDDKGIFKVKK